MAAVFTIVGLGEALFDVFPDKQVLGGAPLNAAVHAHQLAAVRGGRGVVVSRVGQDALGDRLRQELSDRGMSLDYIQSDPDHPTGRVYVTLDEQGRPDYEIVVNAAWDWLQWDPDLEDLARRCDAVCFGSLSQRHNQTRGNVQRFVADARQAIRLFDLTLRQHYYDRFVLRRSCELANVLKLNLEELEVLCQTLGITEKDVDRRVAALHKEFKLRLVAVTRGEKGTVLYSPTTRYEGAPAVFQPAPNADTVGAGDACTAAIMVGLILRLPPQKIADAANQIGAYLASVPGATPKLPVELLQLIR